MKKDFRVLFYVYPTAFQSPGGGEVQLTQTKKYLEELGISVKLFDPWQDKLKDYDILHTFGSVKDCLPMMEAAKNAGIKNVLSTICWYSWKSAWLTYSEPSARIISALRHAAKVFLPFLPSERKRMMEIADILLPNSKSESLQLQHFFGMPENKILIVPNGVSETFAAASPELFISKYGFKNFVLSVGRIEPRKNQLNMIRALNNIAAPVVIIGDYVPHYRNYYEQCKKEASSNIHFLGAMPHASELLPSAYAACHSFVLPSWLETPGLAALEAGLAGANVVITTEGATREYFSDYAAYAAPEDAAGMRRAVENSLTTPKDGKLKNYVLQNYLWKNAAQKNLDAYQRVL